MSYPYNKLPVVIHDRIEPVSYRQHGTLPEFRLDGFLNQFVCLHVYSRRRLVKDQYICLVEQGARQTHQLSLSHAEMEWNK